jgi:hypothetical protein
MTSYELFLIYNAHCVDNGLWDDMDRVNYCLKYVMTGLGPGNAPPRHQVSTSYA